MFVCPLLIAGAMLAASSGAQASPEPSVVAPAEIVAEPDFAARTADRLAPAAVPALERGGVRYSQALDGRDVGFDQVGGALIASDARSGKRLWALAVYPNPVAPGLEADVQWVFFASMAFESDGRLKIVNETGKVFFVDVKARSVVGVQSQERSVKD